MHVREIVRLQSNALSYVLRICMVHSIQGKPTMLIYYETLQLCVL
jgi:hypothetical protein